jgi:ankyrin repeat domain-containing protein 17
LSEILHFREGHLATTKLLLNLGAEVNTPSGSNDDTPLTLACWKGKSGNIQIEK